MAKSSATGGLATLACDNLRSATLWNRGVHGASHSLGARPDVCARSIEKAVTSILLRADKKKEEKKKVMLDGGFKVRERGGISLPSLLK